MNKNLLRLFQFNGSIAYIHSDRFVNSYKDLDGVASGDEKLWISYMSKEAEQRTRKIGLELYSSIDKYNKLKQECTDVYQNISKIKDFDSIKEFFDLCIKYGELYRLTEFFYTDLAFEQRENNQNILENFETFGQFKLEGRTRLNAIFFMQGSFLEIFLKRISSILDISVNDLYQYSMSEILGGKKLSQKIIDQRKLAHIVYAENGMVKNIIGDQALNIIQKLHNTQQANKEIKGTMACKGFVRGKAKVIKINPNDYKALPVLIDEMRQGDILVVESTEPAIIPACKKAGAIITNQSGLMSHAAIAARAMVTHEFKIPCIVGIGNATEIIKTGDLVEVDADKGIVKVL